MRGILQSILALLILMAAAPSTLGAESPEGEMICGPGVTNTDQDYDTGVDIWVWAYVDGECKPTGSGWRYVHHEWDFGTLGEVVHENHMFLTAKYPAEGGSCEGSGCAYTKETGKYSNDGQNWYTEAVAEARLYGY